MLYNGNRNQSAAHGPLAEDVFEDADDFEAALKNDEWTELDTVLSEGSMAAFLQLISEDKVSPLLRSGSLQTDSHRTDRG
jgi:hypothetical protein